MCCSITGQSNQFGNTFFAGPKFSSHCCTQPFVVRLIVLPSLPWTAKLRRSRG
jgi:hypothetical protein